MSARVALVIIGRNEAATLKTSLPAIRDDFEKIVYVDSGSTDDSREIARSWNVDVVELDTSLPFTAARARNAGFANVMEDPRDFPYVQFIDGDCELLSDFVRRAVEWLEENSDTALVCGRRLERHPEASVYNRLADIEWDTPVGDTDYAGGDIMIRSKVLEDIGRYRESLIAGEDPEICVRIRRHGWKIHRIDADMTLHDANMHHFSQWWKRNVRAGYAFAEGACLHGNSPQQHWVREARSNYLWGWASVAVIAATLAISPWLLLLLGVYPLQAVRVARQENWSLRNQTFGTKLLYGAHCAFGKIPQFIGQLRFAINRALSRNQTIIEYR